MLKLLRKAGKYPGFKDKAKKKNHEAQIRVQHTTRRDGHLAWSSPPSPSLHSKPHPFQHFSLVICDSFNRPGIKGSRWCQNYVILNKRFFYSHFYYCPQGSCNIKIP